MERLTEKYQNTVSVVACLERCQDTENTCTCSQIEKCLLKLMAYEDLGYEPEELKYIIDDHLRMLNEEYKKMSENNLAVCKKCNKQMTVRYISKNGVCVNCLIREIATGNKQQ